MFQGAEDQFLPMNLSEARKLGYVFALTDERLVFRTPYEQPHSFSTEVKGGETVKVNYLIPGLCKISNLFRFSR